MTNKKEIKLNVDITELYEVLNKEEEMKKENWNADILIEKLTKRIEVIIESNSGEELHLLPELVNALTNLIHLSSSVKMD